MLCGRHASKGDPAMDDQAAVKDIVSAEEWKARCDLAALYRLVRMHEWDDLFFTHISMRVPRPTSLCILIVPP